MLTILLFSPDPILECKIFLIIFIDPTTFDPPPTSDKKCKSLKFLCGKKPLYDEETWDGEETSYKINDVRHEKTDLKGTSRVKYRNSSQSSKSLKEWCCSWL